MTPERWQQVREVLADAVELKPEDQCRLKNTSGHSTPCSNRARRGDEHCRVYAARAGQRKIAEDPADNFLTSSNFLRDAHGGSALQKPTSAEAMSAIVVRSNSKID
jgi:hypothetical protein